MAGVRSAVGGCGRTWAVVVDPSAFSVSVVSPKITAAPVRPSWARSHAFMAGTVGKPSMQAFVAICSVSPDAPHSGGALVCSTPADTVGAS